jgi:hypothetical protein
MCALYIGDQLEGNSSQFHWALGSNLQMDDWTSHVPSVTVHMYSFRSSHINKYRASAVNHFMVASSLCSVLFCPSSRWIYQDKNAVHIHNLPLFATKYLLELRNAPCGTRILLCFSHWIHGTVCLVLVQELELHSRIHLRANKFYFYKMHTQYQMYFRSRINRITACHYISIGKTVLLQQSQSPSM